MAEKKTGNTVKTPEENGKTPSHLEVILKCSHPAKDKDGELIKEDGKVKKHKPEDKIKLPYAEAVDLIRKAFAVKA